MKPKPRMEGSSPEAKMPLTPRKCKQSLDRCKFRFDPPPEAPVFLPTPEEFENPLRYINKIRPIGQKTGICKIIPPPGWKVPFVLDMDKLKFTPRIQRINELEARTRIKLNFIDQLTKFFALKGKTFQIPVLEKRALDLYTLHKLVKELGGLENVTKNKKWGDIALKMELTSTKTPALLRTHYDHLILPFITSRLDMDRKKELGEGEKSDKNSGEPAPSFRELKSLTFLGPGPKMAVCDLAFSKSVKTRTRGKKILYEFDPLAKYMCKSCSNGEIEESLVTCITCDDRYHSSCLIPPLTEANMVGWKCPKCVATEACKSLEEFGFAQAEKEYTLNEFKEMADTFKSNYFKTNNPKDVPTSKVESEFWKVVSSIEESVTVEYGADLHVIDHGSGFPIKNKPAETPIDQELFNKYAESAWNLNNLPVLKASVLRHISADISGMKIPWMYAGMCFATFCWHNEDHWSYSINYLHLGEAKTWYGVPGSCAEDFEKAMKEEAPELFDSQPDILHHLVTIMNPNDIMKTGVPIYRTDQKEGEFVITFPRAYHAGFNQGFNFAEACNFAPYDWLHIGRECITHYSSLKRFCVFSHDELVCKMAEIYDELDKKILLATYKDMRTMVNAEHTKRRYLLMQGIRNASRVRFDELPDDERQCFVCKTTCFLSALICKCSPTKLVCLDHFEQLCVCPPSNYKLKYHYKIDELVAILYVMRNKVEHFDKWIINVNKSTSDPNRKIYFRIFTELLIDSKDKVHTKEELLKALEEQVKNCLKMSATAKSFMRKVGGDCLKNEKKNTVDDLLEFSKELKSFPCTLVESNSIKNLIDCAFKLQKVAAKLLNSRVPNRSRIEHCIRLLKTLNLDFKELPRLELKVKECEWLEKCADVLSKPCFLEDVQTLIEMGDKLPNTRLIVKQRNELYELLSSLQSWSDKMKSVYTPPYLTLSEVEEIAEEGNKLSCVDINAREKLWATVREGREVNSRLEALLSGQIVLYYPEISQLVDKAKSMPIAFKSLKILQEQLIDTNRWMAAAKRLFYKRTAPVDLINILWPRKFSSRAAFYSRMSGKSYREIEGIIKDLDPNFLKCDFQNAYREQFNSLLQLRMANCKLRMNKFRTCPCGSVLSGKTLECELCCTMYHSNCFLIDDKSSTPMLYNYYNKLLCSFCIRTKRPPFDKIKELFNESKKMTVKLPECFALEYNISKMNSWLKKARRTLAEKEFISALEIISTNSKKITRAIATKQPKSSQSNQSLASDISADIIRQIIDDMKDFQHVKLSPEKLTELRILMHEGDTLEFSSRENINIWMLLESVKLNIYYAAKETVPPEIKVGTELIKTKMQVIRKANMKLRKKPNIKQVMRKVSIRNLSEVATALKAPRPLKITSTVSNNSSDEPKSPTSPVVSEHEENEECAFEHCLKPIEDSLDWVQCDGKCGQWFHMKCVDLTRHEITEEEEYICSNCAPDEGRELEEEITFETLNDNHGETFAIPLTMPSRSSISPF